MDTPEQQDTPLPSPQAEETQGVLSQDMEMVLHVISHDLRAPIVTIQGFCQELTIACDRLKTLFEEEVLSKSVRESIAPLVTQDIPEAVRFIRAGADSVSSVTSGIFRFIRLGQMDIQRERLAMNELMMSIVSSLEYQLKHKGVAVHIGDLPDCIGDEVLVTQVFANLIDNAQKYLDPKRPGEIAIQGKHTNGWSTFSVSDNGIGISPEHHGRIFHVFHQLDPRQEKGEGLGLAIVQRIIDRHQGKIEVESLPGEGTTFHVYFPRVVEGEEERQHES